MLSAATGIGLFIIVLSTTVIVLSYLLLMSGFLKYKSQLLIIGSGAALSLALLAVSIIVYIIDYNFAYFVEVSLLVFALMFLWFSYEAKNQVLNNKQLESQLQDKEKELESVFEELDKLTRLLVKRKRRSK